jgi:hypothetical protein
MLYLVHNSNHDSDFELKVQQSAGDMDATQLFIHKNMSWFSFHASAARFCLVLWCLTTDMPALRGVASFALLPQQPLVAGKSAESKLRLEKLFRKSDFVGDGPFQSDAKNTPRAFARAAQEKKDQESDDSGNISSESNDESNSPTNPSNINDVDESGEGETTERDTGSMKVGDESLVISPPLKTNKVLSWNDPQYAVTIPFDRKNKTAFYSQPAFKYDSETLAVDYFLREVFRGSLVTWSKDTIIRLQEKFGQQSVETVLRSFRDGYDIRENLDAFGVNFDHVDYVWKQLKTIENH